MAIDGTPVTRETHLVTTESPGNGPSRGEGSSVWIVHFALSPHQWGYGLEGGEAEQGAHY